MASRSEKSGKKIGLKRDVDGDQLKSVMSKFVREKGAPAPTSPSARRITPAMDSIETTSKKVSGNSEDAEAIGQILPDLKIIQRIMVGSVLSPRDLTDTDVTVTSDSLEFNDGITRPLLQVVSNYIKKTHKINERLEGILTDTWFVDGSYPILVLPENNIDQIINGEITSSNESYKDYAIKDHTSQGLGFLGGLQSHISFEAYSETGVAEKHSLPGIQITDNFNIFKEGAWKERLRKASVRGVLRAQAGLKTSASLERYKGMSDAKLEALYKEKRENDRQENIAITPQAYMNRASIGHPLPIYLPAESVIPIHHPGTPEDHIAYFIVLDDNNRPVSRARDRDYYGDIKREFEATGKQDDGSSVIQQVRRALGYRKEGTGGHHEQFASIITQQLHNALRAGMFDEDLEFDFQQNILSIMLWRQLKNRNTKILFIPKEIMTYIAFDYNQDGTGKTLLQDMKILLAARSSLFFANHMGQLASSVSRKRFRLTIDEDDPDPEKTIAIARDTILNDGARSFPIGASNPVDMVDALKRDSYSFEFDSNNPKMPQTRMVSEDAPPATAGGNEDYADTLRRATAQSFGIPPELVDPQSSPDFATSVVNNNQMMARWVQQAQKKFMAKITEYVQNLVRYSSVIRGELAKELSDKDVLKLLTKEQKSMDGEELLDMFIDSLEVTLPSPDTNSLIQQAETLRSYVEFIDIALDGYLPPDAFEGLDGYNRARASIKGRMVREWMGNNNVAPELDQLIGLFSPKDEEQQLSSLVEYVELVKDAVKRYEEGTATPEPIPEEEPTSTDDADLGDGTNGEGEPTDNPDDLETGDDQNVNGDDEEVDPNLEV